MLRVAANVLFTAAAATVVLWVVFSFAYLTRPEEKYWLNGLANGCAIAWPIWALMGLVLWIWS